LKSGEGRCSPKTPIGERGRGRKGKEDDGGWVAGEGGGKKKRKLGGGLGRKVSWGDTNPQNREGGATAGEKNRGGWGTPTAEKRMGRKKRRCRGGRKLQSNGKKNAHWIPEERLNVQVDRGTH